MNRVHVTLVEILAAAASRTAALVPESAGYLVLSLCDAIGCLPLTIDEAAVLVSTEGAVTLAHKGPALGGPEAARALRAMFARLLEVATGSTAALAAAARPRPAGSERGIEAVAAEIEAALVPVNRAAGKRTLARLARETARALDAGLVDPRALLPKRAPVQAREESAPSVKITERSPVAAAELRPEPAREATPTAPEPDWLEAIPTDPIRIPVELPPSADVRTLRAPVLEASAREPSAPDLTEPGLPPVFSHVPPSVAAPQMAEEELPSEAPAPSLEELSSSSLVTLVEAPVAPHLTPVLRTDLGGFGVAAVAPRQRTPHEDLSADALIPSAYEHEPALHAETRAWSSQGDASMAIEPADAAEPSHASLLQFEFDVLSPSQPPPEVVLPPRSLGLPDSQVLSRTFLQHAPVEETPRSQRRTHTGPLGEVVGELDVSGPLGGADLLAYVDEPSLAPPPVSTSAPAPASAAAPASAPVPAPVPAPAPAAAPAAPSPPRRDRTDDLLERFGRSPEAEAALLRATARSLKTLAGLEPTPPPPTPAISILPRSESRSPAWLPPQPPTEAELAPAPLVPAPRRLRSRLALPFALLVAVVAGASAIAWTHPELLSRGNSASLWGALDLP